MFNSASPSPSESRLKSDEKQDTLLLLSPQISLCNTWLIHAFLPGSLVLTKRSWIVSVGCRFLLLWSAVLIMYPTSLAVIALTFSNYVLQPVFPNCIPPYKASRVLSMVCLCKYGLIIGFLCLVRLWLASGLSIALPFSEMGKQNTPPSVGMQVVLDLQPQLGQKFPLLSNKIVWWVEPSFTFFAVVVTGIAAVVNHTVVKQIRLPIPHP